MAPTTRTCWNGSRTPPGALTGAGRIRPSCAMRSSTTPMIGLSHRCEAGRDGYASGMTSRFAQWTLDVHDVARMAEFWSAVLGYRVDFGSDGDAHLWPPSGGLSVWLQPTD